MLTEILKKSLRRKRAFSPAEIIYEMIQNIFREQVHDYEHNRVSM